VGDSHHLAEINFLLGRHVQTGRMKMSGLDEAKGFHYSTKQESHWAEVSQHINVRNLNRSGVGRLTSNLAVAATIGRQHPRGSES
jgi:hypothetical protein